MHSSYLTNIEEPKNQEAIISPKVIEAYQKLHRNIDQMQSKVQSVMSKQQSQFMVAYRSHITKIKKELGDIKNKSEEQEKMFSANDRIKFLEKQVSVFRQQALTLFQKLQKTHNELENFKKKYEEIYRQYQKAEKTTKESLRLSKQADATKMFYEEKIRELQQDIRSKDLQIEKLKISKQKYSIPINQGKSTNFYRSIGSEKKTKSRYDRAGNNSVVESSGRKSLRQGDSMLFEGNQFKDIFFECVKRVKKQIVLRKNLQKLDVTNISTISQFQTQDKIRVLELFFSDQKLQNQLFQILFPNSLFQKIKAQSNLLNEHGPMSRTTRDFALPKVTQFQKRSISKLEHKNISIL